MSEAPSASGPHDPARRALIAILAVGAVTGIVFAAWPGLDLRIAMVFADPATQARMAGVRPLIDGLRDLATCIITGLAAPAFAALLFKVMWPRLPMLMPGRAALLLVVTLALAPGLLANGILKPHWPRPRPGAVHELGGPLPFVAWWDPRGGCDGNCSFVSGEVAAAAWTLAPAALTPPPWRTAAIAGAIAFTATVAFVRIVQSGHFTSDALFAATFTALIVWLAFAAIYRWPRTRMSDATVEDALASLGLAIHRMLSALWRRASGV